MNRQTAFRRALAHYGAAILVVAIAGVLRASMPAALGSHAVYLTFCPAVMIAALYGGLGPGFLATLLSAFIVQRWVLPMVHPLARLDFADWLGLGIYILSGMTITGIAEVYHRSCARMIAAELLVKMSQQHQESARQIQQSEAKFRLLFEHAPAAVAMFDRDMRYMAVSRRWISDYALDNRDLVGRCHYDVFPELPEHWKEIHQRCLAGAVEQCEGEPFTRANGQTEWLRWEIRPWREAGEGIRGIIIFTELITQRKQAEQSLIAARISAETARAEANRANRAKDHFLAVLSHELRTPLTPVLSLAQMMEQDGSLPPGVRETGQIIRRNVELEARLIDDLLDLTRISRGKLELQVGTVDMHEKLRRVVQICDSDIRSRRLHLVLKLDASAHHVQADAARMQQVLWNLIKNAAKFTPIDGTITLSTSNSEPGQLSVAVQDTGMGIDPDLLPKIFDAFEQGGSDTTRQFGGLGLGLSISKALVELHGGTLTAASEGKGQGATFTVLLPITNPTIQANAQVAPAQTGVRDTERVALMSYRILLVEDHADTARAMARILKVLGYQVRIACTVAEALQIAGAETFHLVISDIGLPDGSGLDLMRQLRVTCPMKGIVVSGFGMEEDIKRSREAGFLVHLTKPVNIHQLETTIGRILQDPSEPLQKPVPCAATPA